MNEQVLQALGRTFGAANVGTLRPRFDAAPLPMVAPSSVEGFRAALELSRANRWRVLPVGLGSKLSWAPAPGPADFVLSTWAYAGVESYEPGDGTLTARAGTTWAELSARVAVGGHALSPDVPRPKGSTLGGVIAAGQSGADRLRHGALREHVLGLTYLLSDGTLGRCGGRLVKNVTGYDLQRLFAGSHGTLGLILEASLRLFPLPEQEVLASWRAPDRGSALAAARRLLGPELSPWSVVLTAHGAEWTVHARLAGRAESVAAEHQALERLLPGARCLVGEAAAPAAQELRDSAFGEIDGPRLVLQVRPSACAVALDVALEALAAPQFRGSCTPQWRCEPGLAVIEAALGARAHDPGLLAALTDSLARALAPLSGAVRLLHGPEGMPTTADAGAPSAGLALMGRLRRQLDPAGTFAAGRFLP